MSTVTSTTTKTGNEISTETAIDQVLLSLHKPHLVWSQLQEKACPMSFDQFADIDYAASRLEFLKKILPYADADRGSESQSYLIINVSDVEAFDIIFNELAPHSMSLSELTAYLSNQGEVLQIYKCGDSEPAVVDSYSTYCDGNLRENIYLPKAPREYLRTNK